MNIPSAGFELRDHTADIALYVWADAIDRLFQKAADGLYAAIGTLRTQQSTQLLRITLKGDDFESLIHDFLSELLYRFECKNQKLSAFRFHQLVPESLDVEAAAAPLDRSRCVFDREVKAVTMHDLSIIHGDDRFEVTLILDI